MSAKWSAMVILGFNFIGQGPVTYFLFGQNVGYHRVTWYKYCIRPDGGGVRVKLTIPDRQPFSMSLTT